MLFSKVKHVVIKNAKNVYFEFLSDERRQGSSNTFFAQKHVLKKVKKTKNGNVLTFDLQDVKEDQYFGIYYKDIESLSFKNSSVFIEQLNDDYKFDAISLYDSKMEINNAIRDKNLKLSLYNSVTISQYSIYRCLDLNITDHSSFFGNNTIIEDLYPSLLDHATFSMQCNSFVYNCYEFWSVSHDLFKFSANVINFFQVQTHSEISKNSLINIYGSPKLKYNTISDKELSVSYSDFKELFFKENKMSTILKSIMNGNEISAITNNYIWDKDYKFEKPDFINSAALILKDVEEQSKTDNIEVVKDSSISIEEKVKNKELELKKKREIKLIELLNYDFPTDHINTNNRANYIAAINSINIKEYKLSNKALSNLKKLKVLFDIKESQACKF